MPTHTFGGPGCTHRKPAPILVTGDWEVADTSGGIVTFRHVFEVESYTRWGAGVSPRVTLPVLRAIIASQRARIENEPNVAWDHLGLTGDADGCAVLVSVGEETTQIVKPEHDPDSGVRTWDAGLGWAWSVFEHDPEVNRVERVVRSDGSIDMPGVRITDSNPCHDSPGTAYTFTWRGAAYTAEDWSTSTSGGLDVYDENGLPATDLFDEIEDDDSGDSPIRQAIDAYEERLTAAYARLGITALIDQANKEALA